MKKPYVILVDDCPDQSGLVERVINQYPVKIELLRLADGFEAVDLLTSPKARQPDLIMIDNKLPIMNGVDVIRRLMEKESMWDVPMVLVSCYLTESQAREAYRAGARSCVFKSLDIIEWNRQMRGVLNYWLEVNSMTSMLAP